MTRIHEGCRPCFVLTAGDDEAAHGHRGVNNGRAACPGPDDGVERCQIAHGADRCDGDRRIDRPGDRSRANPSFRARRDGNLNGITQPRWCSVEAQTRNLDRLWDLEQRGNERVGSIRAKHARLEPLMVSSNEIQVLDLAK